MGKNRKQVEMCVKCAMLQVSVHERLGYDAHRRRQRLRNEYGDSYSRAWSRWNYSFGYQPSYDSTDEWVDYDNPEYYSSYSYNGWRPWSYSGYTRRLFMLMSFFAVPGTGE